MNGQAPRLALRKRLKVIRKWPIDRKPSRRPMNFEDVWSKLLWSFMNVVSKGPGKRGHIVADTLLPTQTFPRLPARATFVADTKMFRFWFCSETFCVPNKCFPVCAAQEASWAISFQEPTCLLGVSWRWPKDTWALGTRLHHEQLHEQHCVRNNVSSFARALTLSRVSVKHKF